MRLDQVKILVLDEVDRMLDMGFQPAIARIATMLPAVRQTLCYSATLEGEVKDVARKYLNNPARIEIGSVLKPAENVELRTFEVEPDKKQELLEHLLDAEQGSFLVFVRTKHGADRVARRLVRSGGRRRRFTATVRNLCPRRCRPVRRLPVRWRHRWRRPGDHGRLHGAGIFGAMNLDHIMRLPPLGRVIVIVMAGMAIVTAALFSIDLEVAG